MDDVTLQFIERFGLRGKRYSIYWQKEGRQGFHPACSNQWTELCPKTTRRNLRCVDCPNSRFQTVTETVVAKHLSGEQIISVYLLLPDNNMISFAALDFDHHKTEPVAAIVKVAKDKGIKVYIATSTKKGFHLYLFFHEPIQASKVRALLKHLIDVAKVNPRPEIFPKQDRLTNTTRLYFLHFLVVPQ